jgi:hypothetical protein
LNNTDFIVSPYDTSSGYMFMQKFASYKKIGLIPRHFTGSGLYRSP